MGYTPGQNWMGNPTPSTGYAWTGYAVGSVPLAVSRRRTLLLVLAFIKKLHSLIIVFSIHMFLFLVVIGNCSQHCSLIVLT